MLGFAGRPLNRPVPKISVENMMTHAIFAPLGTHWRKATCEETGCLDYRNGWGLDITSAGPVAADAAKRSGRRYRSMRAENGDEHLIFEAGQPCFKASEHRVRVDRPELFVCRSGDWRGNPDGNVAPLVFSGADAWKDSLGTALDRCQG